MRPGENTKSSSLDRAAEFYIQMRRNTMAVPNGAFADYITRINEGYFNNINAVLI